MQLLILFITEFQILVFQLLCRSACSMAKGRVHTQSVMASFTLNDLGSFIFSLFFSHIIHLESSLPFPPPSLPPPQTSPDPLLLCFTSKKRRPLNNKQHGITEFNKTRHKHSYQGWTKQSSRRKMSHEHAKCVRNTPHSNC